MRISVLCVSLLFCTAAAAQPRPVYIEEMTWTEVRDAIAAGMHSAIIYTGGTEQNGPHMVLGKHNIVAREVAGRIAAALGDALAYPTLPFAPAGQVSPPGGHMRFPGSVSLSQATFAAVVRDLASSALTAGFRNVFLMGDHGEGQDVLKSVAAELDAPSRGRRVFYVANLYFMSLRQEQVLLAARGLSVEEHAGAGDTSELLYLDASNRWVRRDRLAQGGPAQEAATGVLGDPTRASAELGRELVGNKVENAVAEIRRLLGGGR